MTKKDEAPVEVKKRKPHALYFDKPSLTKQSFKDECDINRIIARVRNGGNININTRAGRYMDVSNVPDYATALAIVKNADDMFAALPAGVRKKFENDPLEMVEFLQDPKNHDEAVKLGLVVPKEAPKGKPEAGDPGGSPVPASEPKKGEEGKMSEPNAT
jgi:phage internal scaffolding protein